MQISARPADVLLFQCGQCRTELSVPVALQGIEGPCPTCGQRIQAPLCPLPVMSRPVHLPPLDRRHELPSGDTESIPLPAWMEPAPPRGSVLIPPREETTEILSPEPELEPASHRSTAPGLLPRQLSVHSNAGFHARLAIPPSGEAMDDSRRGKPLEEHRRHSPSVKADVKWHRMMETPSYNFARVALLLILGGTCAGLGLYLKDRNWVLSLPWRPSPPETLVDVPQLAAPPVAPRAADSPDPFRVEDPSELEALSRPSVLAPIPDAQSFPVGAAPMAAEK